MTSKLWARLFGAALMTVLALPLTATAQEDQPKPEKKAPRADGDDAPGPDGRKARVPAARTTRELMVQTRKLQESMVKELKLSEDQHKEVDAIFDAHYKAFQHEDGTDAVKKEQDAKARLEALREEMKDAREANDREKLRELRKEMMDLRASLYDPAPMEATQKLLDDVSAKLSDEQGRDFRKMAERLGLSTGPRAGAGPLRDLMQVLRAPSLAITPEQNEKIRKIMRDKMAEVRDPELGPEAREDAAKRIEAAVLAELTAEQKTKFEELKTQFANQSARDQLRGRDRAGKPGKDGKDGKDGKEPETGEEEGTEKGQDEPKEDGK